MPRTTAFVTSFGVLLALLLVAPTARSRSVASAGSLDCNGYSAIQAPLKPRMYCADFYTAWGQWPGGRGYDNGHYVGHDEPSISFYSTRHHSGNSVRWEVTLPTDRPLPAVQTFELTPAIWFAMALCDPNSFPNGPCIPDSDENAPAATGSAFLELQLYPPGFPPWITQISCDLTHWCAALNIDSLEVMSNGNLNPNCTEPINFAWLQTNGVPTGPPGPAIATVATYTPNAQTLRMNSGDRLRITITDTGSGLLTRIEDLTTGQSGYMVASGANGFQNTDPNSCAGTNFDFHPEYDTAKYGNFVPWAALQANITLAFETGHFSPGVNGDNDSDDAPCFPGPTVAGCVGEDLDYDGTSYRKDWPDGSNKKATPMQIYAAAGNGIGPAFRSDASGRYDQAYPIMQFETDISATNSNCQPNGIGCTVPPANARFYPFWSVQTGGGWPADGSCTLLFGDMTGAGILDFGRDKEYGAADLPWFFGQNSSGPVATPCLQFANSD